MSEVEKVLEREKIKGIDMYFSLLAEGYHIETELTRVRRAIHYLTWEIRNIYQLDREKIIAELNDMEDSINEVQVIIKALIAEGEYHE